MGETKRTLENKLGLSPQKIGYLESELKRHFDDAWVEGYRPLVPCMSNHAKDRRVVAAAVRCGAQTIVTLNLRDFPSEALEDLNMEAQSPDEFLIHQFHLAPELLYRKLNEQASKHGGLETLLGIHVQIVPDFVALIRAYMARVAEEAE